MLRVPGKRVPRASEEGCGLLGLCLRGAHLEGEGRKWGALDPAETSRGLWNQARRRRRTGDGRVSDTACPSPEPLNSASRTRDRSRGGGGGLPCPLGLLIRKEGKGLSGAMRMRVAESQEACCPHPTSLVGGGRLPLRQKNQMSRKACILPVAYSSSHLTFSLWSPHPQGPYSGRPHSASSSPY